MARMIAWGGQPFGAAIGGVLAQVMGVRWAFLLMAVGVAASLAIGWFSPLRARAPVSLPLRRPTEPCGRTRLVRILHPIAPRVTPR